MTDVRDISWGSYLTYEGPFFRGSVPFLTPSDPSDAAKILSVFTATEGGRYDAINMYDRCILSVGLIQWCEGGQFSVSDLLGAVVGALRGIPAPLQTQLSNVGVDFKKNARGRWRFFFRDARGEVDRLDEQKQLFLLRSSGLKASWDQGSKEYAKSWATAVANTMALPGAQEAQVAFTAPKLMSFAMPEAKAALWGENDPPSMNGWPGALRAGFLSFAGNLPAVANNQLKVALSKVTSPKWSPDWCIGILKQLTFGPEIAIYPIRYNAIRPVIERLYDVNLPDFSPDLHAWSAKMGIDWNEPVPTFTSPKDIQAELIAEGFDLGPAGADGKMGPKTQQAIMTFQGLHGLSPDGIVGPKTRQAFLSEWKRRN